MGDHFEEMKKKWLAEVKPPLNTKGLFDIKALEKRLEDIEDRDRNDRKSLATNFMDTLIAANPNIEARDAATSAVAYADALMYVLKATEEVSNRINNDTK